ncbi:GGDEF domain-containing protein [Massilia timonae]|uniref:diguanylate cyclase n=2 Tax=Massilia timonae TaxID=47229 RepID=K9DKK1_9BURK|nr:GGDEF domain-containing protein [Massilia timonae]EKU83806.1 diguanylate cyclase (GGDEF) domain-containing protein [Massilia timonae CCUG 45783]HAK92425.1 GGDEF domain-containing protein [Massilia timonae]
MIDIQTFLLALGIGNVGFAILMAGYTHGAQRNPGLHLWMWARLGMGLSQLAGWARPMVGLAFLGGLEGIGWILAVSLEMAAYCVFFGFTRWGRIVLPIAVLSSAVVIAAGVHGASHAQLSALVAGVVALFAAAMAWVLLRRRHASLLQRIIGINDALFSVAVSLWAGSTLLGKGPFDHVLAREAAYLAGYMLMIVNGFGFLLLCKQKDDARMARLASTDCLTGLPNRHAFMERAERARLASQRQRHPLALMMIDIDHFKQINDRWGHASGDDALQVFARTARDVMREHETIGRLGGEEFAMMLPGADIDAAMQAAQRLRQAVRAATVITSGPSYTMTVSIGVVVLDPNEDLSAALARADHALYTAKRAGRDRVEVGDPVRRRA